MEPVLPAVTDTVERDSDMNDDAKRKIQFSVPSAVPTQLDPRQVELIRRRRPTPATLFRLTDHPSPEEDGGSHQWVLGENGALKAKMVNTYQPPSLKAVQRMAQAHLSSIDMTSVDQDDPPSGEEDGADSDLTIKNKTSEPLSSASVSWHQGKMEDANARDEGE
ncbi:protein phosphatase 1 regulatory subunit 1B-like [Dunckerocampus dactyliophorus]|uniref:protein phosphatase 1 regulatory subunit 1B-like n=1 Tax=Dunckerocampus dactyliophorus TaxID=161453 RepID=UPI002404CDDF|nr:protein phosphatase 1 regulatory subunit 1B-like [Dunckerocampus dactyliophorus]